MVNRDAYELINQLSDIDGSCLEHKILALREL